MERRAAAYRQLIQLVLGIPSSNLLDGPSLAFHCLYICLLHVALVLACFTCQIYLVYTGL